MVKKKVYLNTLLGIMTMMTFRVNDRGLLKRYAKILEKSAV